MTRVKIAQAHIAKNDGLFMVVGLCWLAGVAVLTNVTDDQGLVGMGALAGFLVFVVIVVWRLNRLDKAFRCLDCGGEVTEPLEADDGAPILRHCQNCDVLWKVGTVPNSG